jgi:hypothetical protein
VARDEEDVWCVESVWVGCSSHGVRVNKSKDVHVHVAGIDGGRTQDAVATGVEEKHFLVDFETRDSGRR